MTAIDQHAVQAPAELRLQELRAVRAVLWMDRDDPEVMSELVSIQSQIRSCEEALAA
jgi:hypothetical protein